MIKTLLAQVKQYKKASLLTPLYAALEVVMEVLIPFITAAIIDKGIEAGSIARYISTVHSCWCLPCSVCSSEFWQAAMRQALPQVWPVI